jgi:hypothetical protein
MIFIMGGMDTSVIVTFAISGMLVASAIGFSLAAFLRTDFDEQ